MAGLQPSKINYEFCCYTDDVARMDGLQPSKINHELCHYTDDVARMLGFNPAISAMNSVTTLVTSRMVGLQPRNRASQ
jgi:hypothetical protein